MKAHLTAVALAFGTPSTATDTSQYFVELYDYKYTEPGLMSKVSPYAFAGIGYQDYKSQYQNGFVGNAKYFVGTTDYTSSSTGKTKNDLTTGLSGEISYKYNSFYVGLGFRQLNDRWGGKQSSTGHFTYNRRSQYLYAPLGNIIYNNRGGYFKYQVNYLISGNQTSYITQAGYSQTTNTQDSGYGVELEWLPNHNYGVFATHWNIADSSVNNGLYEPQNTTTEIGFKLLF